MNRFQASAIHLGISLTVAAIVGCLIYFVWYPYPYFQMSGGNKLMLLIMSVDIAIGPLLTLVVYKAGKKGLRFDLTCIAILQACAFFYGLSVIVKARPVFIVAAIDRFTPVYADDLEDVDLAQAKQPEFAHRSWTGPKLVGAIMPTDQKEKNALMSSGIFGKDLEKFPKYYASYAQVADALMTKAKPLSTLADKSPQNKAIIEQFLASHHVSIDGLVYFPLIGRTGDYTMIVSVADKQPLDAIAIDPW